jgi:hypothetical protein
MAPDHFDRFFKGKDPVHPPLDLMASSPTEKFLEEIEQCSQLSEFPDRPSFTAGVQLLIKALKTHGSTKEGREGILRILQPVSTPASTTSHVALSGKVDCNGGGKANGREGLRRQDRVFYYGNAVQKSAAPNLVPIGAVSVRSTVVSNRPTKKQKQEQQRMERLAAAEVLRAQRQAAADELREKRQAAVTAKTPRQQARTKQQQNNSGLPNAPLAPSVRASPTAPPTALSTAAMTTEVHGSVQAPGRVELQVSSQYRDERQGDFHFVRDAAFDFLEFGGRAYRY